MEQDKLHALLQKRDRAVARGSNWIKLLRNAYQLSQPNRNVFKLEQAPGTLKNFETYDGTLVLATRRFVNKLQFSLMPENVNWMQFALSDKFKREVREEVEDEEQFDSFMERVDKLLDARTQEFFDYFRRSNAYNSVNEAFYDMAVSTGALQINEGDDQNPVIFSSIPADKIYFCEGPWGSIDTVFRDFVDLELENAQQMWPGFKTPSALTSNRDPFQTLTLYEISFYDYKKKIYTTLLVHSGTKEVCWEVEEESWPFVIFRWMKLAGEHEGRGPVLDAYPSAATVNEAMRDEILAAEFMSKPIYLGFSDGLFNPHTFNMVPNTVIPVSPSASGGTWPITPLPKSGDITWGAIVVNDLRMQIDKIMFNMPLGPIQDAPPLTATEVAIRQNEMLEDQAASYIRMQREFFNPMIKRVLWILQKRGLMKKFEVDGRTLDIEYRTPLSTGKGQIDVNQLIQYFQTASSMIGPVGALTSLKQDAIPNYLAKNLNVDMSLIATREERQQAVQNMMQMQQQLGGMNEQ